MTWIKCSERLPEENEDCWIYYPKEDFVGEGFFKKCCPFCIPMKIDPNYKPGFCFNEDQGGYSRLEEVSHWMPYYTPKPPKEE